MERKLSDKFMEQMSPHCRVDYDGEHLKRVQILITSSVLKQMDEAVAAGKANNRSHLARLALRDWLNNTQPTNEMKQR